jgi:hypothetical protein
VLAHAPRQPESWLIWDVRQRKKRRTPTSIMNQSVQSTVIENGVSLGAVIAVVVSWHRNRSILWAIFHGIFSWLYVIYYAMTRDERS